MDLEALRAEHGEVLVLEAMGYRVAVRMPTEAEFDAFVAGVSTPAKGAASVKVLFRRVVVWPSRPEVDAMLKAKPGLGITFGNKVADWAGLGAEIEAEKSEPS